MAIDPISIDESEPPRLLEAQRKQLRLGLVDLEGRVPEDHLVRMVWAMVERLDLSKWHAAIRSRGTQAGRPAIDPKILVTLWLQACLEGIGSAREVERRCERDDVYRWICGGVAVNHHTLSDFRVGNEEAIDDLMQQVIGMMLHKGIIRLKRVAADGTRVRACAGAASFRRDRGLRESFEKAKEHLERVKRQAEDEEGSERERAAQRRAMKEKVDGMMEALKELETLKQIKKTPQAKKEARVSTTDPQARVMKMSDGGFSPAYNVQLGVDTESRAIVGVRVTNQGADSDQGVPMLEDVQRRTGKLPEEFLVDAGYATQKMAEEIKAKGPTLFAPLKPPRLPGHDRFKPKSWDTPAYAELRTRMKTQEAQGIYRERSSTVETVNADLKTHRALGPLLVRGIPKVTSAVIWSALAYNVFRAVSLGALS